MKCRISRGSATLDSRLRTEMMVSVSRPTLTAAYRLCGVSTYSCTLSGLHTWQNKEPRLHTTRSCNANNVTSSSSRRERARLTAHRFAYDSLPCRGLAHSGA